MFFLHSPNRFIDFSCGWLLCDALYYTTTTLHVKWLWVKLCLFALSVWFLCSQRVFVCVCVSVSVWLMHVWEILLRLPNRPYCVLKSNANFLRISFHLLLLLHMTIAFGRMHFNALDSLDFHYWVCVFVVQMQFHGANNIFKSKSRSSTRNANHIECNGTIADSVGGTSSAQLNNANCALNIDLLLKNNLEDVQRSHWIWLRQSTRRYSRSRLFQTSKISWLCECVIILIVCTPWIFA